MRKIIISFGVIVVAAAVLLAGCAKTVTLNIEETENGRIVVRSPGLDDEKLSKGGSLSLPEGAAVSATAEGDEGYEFIYWNGSDSEDRSIFFTITDDLTLGAEFSTASYMASLDTPLNGKLRITPAIKAGTAYPANTVFSLTAIPDDGYEIDSTYYAVPGPWWVNYYESPDAETTIKLTSDMAIGASFIKSEEIEGFSVIQDVVYAKPGVKTLKYDVYSPDGAAMLPLVIIVHGGGWSSNDEDIMRGMAREIAKTGKYVAVSIDYRWIGNLDGDAEANGMDDLINDVYGAIAHIIEHASGYGADAGRIAITGDSAGGHLSASAATMIERIGNGGFGEKEGVYEYMPTYLPEGQSVDEFRNLLKQSMKVAAPSYGVFDSAELSVSPVAGDSASSEDAQIAISPIDNIPEVSKRSIPQYLVRGTNDPLITDEGVQAYADALAVAGQAVEYIQVSGAGHAFYDWKPDRATKETFAYFGIPNIEKMLNFFEKHL